MSTVMEIISIRSVLTSFQLKLQLHLQGDCSALSQIVGTQGPFISMSSKYSSNKYSFTIYNISLSHPQFTLAPLVGSKLALYHPKSPPSGQVHPST